MSSPWAPIAAVEPVDLQAIMSEQNEVRVRTRLDAQYCADLAAIELEASQTEEATRKSLQTDHQIPLSSSASPADDNNIDAELLATLEAGGEADNVSDAMLAKLLQDDFDREHDAELQRFETAHNKNSKVTVSYANYRRHRGDVDDASSGDDGNNSYGDDHRDDDGHVDRFTQNERILDSVSKRGGIGYDDDGVIVSKHDAKLNAVRNACRVMSFPLHIRTGDTAGCDVQLPNAVYNQLKTFTHRIRRSVVGARRKTVAVDRREHSKTVEMGIDGVTYLLLYRLVTSVELLRDVHGIVSTGKEAIILHADGNTEYSAKRGGADDADDGDDADAVPAECALKVFKTTLNEFKQRDRYIADDFRFKDRYGKQNNNRSVIELWAEKEMHNLNRMRRVGIRCPRVVMLRKNVLVMEFVGADMRASPKLKDAVLSERQLKRAYAEVVDAMTVMYWQAKLVHADLSEYNVLWHRDECWFIDVAQSVEPSHPSALELMMRDCGNVSAFFTRRGVPDVLDRDELFNSITGLDPSVHTATMLERIHDKGANRMQATVNNFDDMPEHMKPRTYPFEYAWDKLEDEKEAAAEAKKLSEKSESEEDEREAAE